MLFCSPCFFLLISIYICLTLLHSGVSECSRVKQIYMEIKRKKHRLQNNMEDTRKGPIIFKLDKKMQPLPAWEILHYLPSRQSNPQQKIRAHQPLQTYEQITAKQHTHCSPRLKQLISLYSHVIPHERLILHVLLFIVLYWCDMYLCTSIVIQCLFQWIGRQVICPHETDLSNKVLMYPENFWSSIVSYAPYQRVEHCLSGTWIKTLLSLSFSLSLYIYIYVTGKLRNQAFREMSKKLSHFVKWLIQLGISWNDWNI